MSTRIVPETGGLPLPPCGLQTRRLTVLAALTQPKYSSKAPPKLVPATNALGTPRAMESPSLAPLNASAASVAQLFGPSPGTDTLLKVLERCSTMGVPPPMVTEPLAATSPFASTLHCVVPWYLPSRMLPELAEP